MKKSKADILCSFYIIAAGSLWGMMGLFVRNLAADGFGSFEIATVRPFLATILMGVFLLIKDKSRFRIKLKDIWVFVGTGVVSLTFFNVCYFTTLQRTSMAVAAILMYTSPVFIVVLSFFLFKEKIFALKIVALFVALAGIAFVTGVFSSGDSSVSVSTILIGLGSGLGYALYSIFGRYAIEREYSSGTITFYTFLFSMLGTTVYNLIIGAVSGNALGTYIVITSKIASGRPVADILLFAGQAVLVTVLPYILYTMGLTVVENGKAGIMASVEPVVAALLGMIVYKEVLSVSSYIGVVLVLIAIVLLNLKDKNSKSQE